MVDHRLHPVFVRRACEHLYPRWLRDPVCECIQAPRYFLTTNKRRKCFKVHDDFRSAGYNTSAFTLLSSEFETTDVLIYVSAGDAESWTGSSLDITSMTKDGSVHLFTIEEHDQKNSKGFVNKLLGVFERYSAQPRNSSCMFFASFDSRMLFYYFTIRS